ncbi:hypothetical protein AN958_00459, partial [Leucoagaricus sp. SymC.cos]
KVTVVTVYGGRAEVAQEARVSVETGQNKVTVTGLTSSLVWATMRIEGRGAGTIQGVTVSDTIRPPKIETPASIEALKEKQGEVEAAIKRYKRGRNAVYKFLQTLDVQHLNAEKLTGIIQASDESLKRLDSRMGTLQKGLEALKKKVVEEKERLNRPFTESLCKQVEIGVFADRRGEVVLVLKYDAVYDARVNTQTKEEALELIYQAKIGQNTGENWDDVPILLETNTLTLNVNLSTLPLQRLEVLEKTTDSAKKSAKKHLLGQILMLRSSGQQLRIIIILPIFIRKSTSRTGRSATIPSDNNNHNVTIAELELDTALSWVVVPRQDVRAHIQARIDARITVKLKNPELALPILVNMVTRTLSAN